MATARGHALALVAGLVVSLAPCSCKGHRTETAPVAPAADTERGWSDPVPVGDEFEPLAHYRARLEADHLVIEVRHTKGWHSYAMDNEVRAAEKLQDVESLGIEEPTSFAVEGAHVASGWWQTPPEDLSDEKIQWYTWGFNGKAVFVARIGDFGSDPIVIGIFGQICNAETCRSVDVRIRVDPARNRITSPPDLGKLIRVRVPQAKNE